MRHGSRVSLRYHCQTARPSGAALFHHCAALVPTGASPSQLELPASQLPEASAGFRDELAAGKDTFGNNFSSRAHHLGTTRMSDNPLNGVVDSNCKVYGVSNLYVAGSSVFPTGGHANPTLTLIALTLRLADHLKKSNLPPKKSTSYTLDVKPKKVFYMKALRLLSNITLIFSARN